MKSVKNKWIDNKTIDTWLAVLSNRNLDDTVDFVIKYSNFYITRLNSIYKMVKIEFNAATFILAVVVRWLPLIICFLLFSISFYSFHRNIHVYNFELLQLCNISDVKIHMFMPFKKQWAFDTISKDVSRGHVR